MRRMGGLPVERCKSEAFCSNIRLKKASILAIQPLSNSKSDTAPAEVEPMNELESSIRQEILPTGSISFARFTELALYFPKIGYYERKPPVIGKAGDFYTSVSVGPLFGELLARRFADWL